jgi:ferredoxin
MSPRRGANAGRRLATTWADVPSAELAKPGLVDSLTDHPRTPRACQSCGTPWDAENPLARWLEHDERDELPRAPERPRVVVLCRRCSDRLIDPHPRLYKLLDNGAAFPGCMSVCLTCEHRVDGTSCTHPGAKLNGGEGLSYRWKSEPIYAHVYYGGGRGEFMASYPGPVTQCSGYAPHPRDVGTTEEEA